MSVSGPSRVRHLFALSRWILQGFNPIYEFRFSFFGKAKYLILFCRRPCSALGFIFHGANQPAAGSREASPNRRDVAWQRAVSGMRQVASGKCQCEWQDNVGAALRGEWQRQVQRVALYYAYRTLRWGGTATGLAMAPLPLTWPVTLTSLMKNSLIMRTFLIHMRPGNLPRQINPQPQPQPRSQEPEPEQDPERDHSFTRPFKPQTIHQSINQLPPPLCMWPEMLLSKYFQLISGSGFKVLYDLDSA